MKLRVVADVSVLADLCHGHLLDRFAALAFDVTMSDMMAEEEMDDVRRECPRHRWRTEGLSGDELKRLQILLERAPGVSVNDVSALLVAERQGAVLLTGDAHLRELAKDEKVPCHGVLWCLDRIEAAGADGPTLHRALSTMVAHPRARLPKAEVLLRLARYGTTPGEDMAGVTADEASSTHPAASGGDAQRRPAMRVTTTAAV